MISGVFIINSDISVSRTLMELFTNLNDKDHSLDEKVISYQNSSAVRHL
jgi:hypothetical protein